MRSAILFAVLAGWTALWLAMGAVATTVTYRDAHLAGFPMREEYIIHLLSSCLTIWFIGAFPMFLLAIFCLGKR